MGITPALRTLAIALVSGGVLTVAATGTASAGTATAGGTTSGGSTAGSSGSGGSEDPVWGTVVSRGDLNLRAHPDTGSAVLGRLSPGSQDRVACVARGTHVFGNPHWYWLVGARAWASAAFVDIGGAGVPRCSDPCEGAWKDRWHDGSGAATAATTVPGAPPAPGARPVRGAGVSPAPGTPRARAGSGCPASGESEENGWPGTGRCG